METPVTAELAQVAQIAAGVGMVSSSMFTQWRPMATSLTKADLMEIQLQTIVGNALRKGSDLASSNIVNCSGSIPRVNRHYVRLNR